MSEALPLKPLTTIRVVGDSEARSRCEQGAKPAIALLRSKERLP